MMKNVIIFFEYLFHARHFDKLSSPSICIPFLAGEYSVVCIDKEIKPTQRH